jgi:hypothetical protein
MGAVVWAEAPEDDADETETEAPGEVDQTFASRKLRRWLKGMFGGARPPSRLTTSRNASRSCDETARRPSRRTGISQRGGPTGGPSSV